MKERLGEAEDRASRQAWAHAEALQVRTVLGRPSSLHVPALAVD